LRPASHPVYTLYCQIIFQLRSKPFFNERLPAASCLIVAYTAGAAIGFAAVWANAFTIVDKVSTFFATGTFFLSHPHAPSAINVSGLKE
jgi:hypothetical protein